VSLEGATSLEEVAHVVVGIVGVEEAHDFRESSGVQLEVLLHATRVLVQAAASAALEWHGRIELDDVVADAVDDVVWHVEDGGLRALFWLRIWHRVHSWRQLHYDPGLCRSRQHLLLVDGALVNLR